MGGVYLEEPVPAICFISLCVVSLHGVKLYLKTGYHMTIKLAYFLSALHLQLLARSISKYCISMNIFSSVMSIPMNKIFNKINFQTSFEDVDSGFDGERGGRGNWALRGANPFVTVQ